VLHLQSHDAATGIEHGDRHGGQPLTTGMRQAFIDDLRRLDQCEHGSSYRFPEDWMPGPEPDELAGPRSQPGQRPGRGLAAGGVTAAVVAAVHMIAVGQDASR
jgi:hypothetical protein